MNYDVVQIEYMEEYRLMISFKDGSSGVVNFLSYIQKGGVFMALQDISQFKQFSIGPVWNTVIWKDGELDIAPETLYLKATGRMPVREPIEKVAEESPHYGESSLK